MSMLKEEKRKMFLFWNVCLVWVNESRPETNRALAVRNCFRIHLARMCPVWGGGIFRGATHS